MDQHTANSPRRQAPWVKILLLLALVALTGIGIYISSDGPASPPARKATAAKPETLLGRWERPDGGYVLEIRKLLPDNRLEAAYLNPQPINVAKAEMRRQDGRLNVFVELRDVNYPGSTYTLTYVPERDRLEGLYYQATQGQTFEVAFERMKQ